MAFTLKNLENHSGSGAGKKIWSYDTSDAMATVVAADYFLGAMPGLLSVGDVIYIEASDGTAWVTVTAASTTTVTVGPGAALEGSTTHDFGSIATAAEEAVDVTVTGAALGDFAMASVSVDVTDLVISASVTAADTVTVVAANVTGGAVDLASATVRARVFKAAS